MNFYPANLAVKVLFRGPSPVSLGDYVNSGRRR